MKLENINKYPISILNLAGTITLERAEHHLTLQGIDLHEIPLVENRRTIGNYLALPEYYNLSLENLSLRGNDSGDRLLTGLFHSQYRIIQTRLPKETVKQKLAKLLGFTNDNSNVKFDKPEIYTINYLITE